MSNEEINEAPVTITVNGVDVQITSGRYSASRLKQTVRRTGGPDAIVSASDLLFSLPDYHEHAETDLIMIQGGEKFVTSAPDGVSS